MSIYYLDHAATTPVDLEVQTEMIKAMKLYNPSSPHALGREARRMVEHARKQVADLINAEPEQIIFTSGGTEANNLALNQGDIVATTPVEHHSILNAKHVRMLDESRQGVDLISVMWVNNEIGTVHDVTRSGEKAHSICAEFHTDAVQALGQIPIDVKDKPIDYMSMSAHKIYGPKGVGALYVKSGELKRLLIKGGNQERGFRSGTENVIGIVGFGKACEIAQKNFDYNVKHSKKIKDALWTEILKIPGARYNGVHEHPGILSITFDGVPADTLMLMLEDRGIYISSGAACTSGSQEPSHVLKAIGLTDKQAFETVRISVGRSNNIDDVPYIVRSFNECIEQIRKLQR